jgi:ferric-dicitrate binding protein FerR (iron transport regulator)
MSEDIFWNLLAKKLAKEATPEELAHLEELMCQYPEWVYAARHIQDMWILPSGKHNSESEKAFQQQLNKMNENGIDTSPWIVPPVTIQKTISFYKQRWLILLAAASVAGLISILLLSVFSHGNHLPQTRLHSVSTHLGSKSKIILPDGSVVWLNAGSKLNYDKDFGTNERHVTLEGEAFFDVVKMTNLPFIIQTKVIQVKVLGTVFNVKSYANEPTTETSLIKGKVEITINNRPEEKFMLLPDNKLIVSNEILEKDLVIKPTQTKKRIPLVALERLTYYEKDSTIVETSWKENRLVFQDESFEDIARKMERWYSVAFVFKNQNLKAERFTGSFTSETIIQALEALQIAADFKFKTDQNKIILTR